MKSSLFTPLGSLFIAAWALVKTEIVHIKNTANLPQCISVTAFRALDVVSKSILNGMRSTSVKAIVLMKISIFISVYFIREIETEHTFCILI